jgi:hypothetical protein
MTIEELADLLQLNLTLKRFNNWQEPWKAGFDNTETMESPDSSIIGTCRGVGNTPEEAIVNYVSRLRGQLLVTNSHLRSERKEFMVPRTLTR